MKEKMMRFASCLVCAFMVSSQFTPAVSFAGTQKDAADDDLVFAEAEEMAEKADTAGAAYDGFIFRLKDDVVTTLDADEAEGIEEVKYSDNTFTADSLEDIESAVSEDAVEYIEPDYIVKLYDSEGPDDKYYQSDLQWNLKHLKVNEAWDYNVEGQDLDDSKDMDYNGSPSDDKVIVGVIDSGLKVGHEDIDWSRVLTGKNFADTSSTSTDDTLGHGTFCTGEIMAIKNNTKGIAGIGQDIYVMPLKVFISDSASTSVIVSAINYAAEERENFNSSKGSEGSNISVINMSLGSESASTTMKEAVERCKDAGIIVVCAAGNDGDTTASYPAQYAIGVGATDSDMKPADFSQRLSSSNGSGYANKVWVSAPGEDITSLYSTSTSSYCTASGTSFSSPEVAALAALAVGLKNDLTTYYNDSEIATNHDAFKQLLKDTAVPMTGSSGNINGQDVEYGWGFVDFSAVTTALIGEIDGTGNVTVKVVNEAGTKIPSAQITITDPTTDSEVQPLSDGTYNLQMGRKYSYTATADKYEMKSGTLVTLTAEKTVTVILEGDTYRTRFSVLNTKNQAVSDTSIEVNRVGYGQIEQNPDGSFNTKNGDYKYTITAPGYFEKTGSFTIDDLEDSSLESGNKVITVTINGDIDVCTTTLTVIGADGSDITSQTVSSGSTVTYMTGVELKDEEGNEVNLYTDSDGSKSYKLSPGLYSYTAKNSSYKTVSGSFVIQDSDRGSIKNKKIFMQDKIYSVTFDVLPLYAAYAARTITITNGLGEKEKPATAEDSLNQKYSLCNGTYKYKVTADGYKTLTGTFTVKGKKVTVELEMEEGEGVIDDGTYNDEFFTVNSSYFLVGDLKKLASEKTLNIGGQETQITGSDIKTIIENFTPNVQTAAGVKIEDREGNVTEISSDDFENALITWDDQGQLQLAVNGSQALSADPCIITVDYHQHNENVTVVSQASCTEAGIRHHVCVECGQTWDEMVAALGHNYDSVTGICSRCGDQCVYDDDTSITLGTSTTVTSAQMRQYATVAYYDMYDYSSGETDSHLVVGITLKDLVDHFVPGNCVSKLTISSLDGYTMEWSRTEFETTMIAWLIDGQKPGSYSYDNHLRIAQDGAMSSAWLYSPDTFAISSYGQHSYGDPVVTEATCAKDGYSLHTCTVCGHVEKYDIVPATGQHNWDEGTVQKEAGCITEGQKVIFCTTCGASIIQTIPAAGHKWQDGVCTVCGAVMQQAAEGIQKNSDGVDIAVISGLEEGYEVDAENTFTVTSDMACQVFIKNGDNYERLQSVKNEDGSRSYTAVLGADSVICVMASGDVDGDGSITVSDIMLMTSSILSGNEVSGTDLIQDVNGDGLVNILDVLDSLSASLGRTVLNW